MCRGSPEWSGEQAACSARECRSRLWLLFVLANGPQPEARISENKLNSRASGGLTHHGMTRKKVVDDVVLDVEDRAILRHELDLVTILHHRNKNQHHGATWYKYIKVLKSALTRIIAIDESAINSKAERARVDELLGHQERFSRERLAFLGRTRSMYLSFTQIVGTGQYVPLGMILLGILARVWKVLIGPGPAAPIAEVVVADESANEHRSSDVGEDDEGVVVQRGQDELLCAQARSTGSIQDTKLVQKETPTTTQISSAPGLVTSSGSAPSRHALPNSSKRSGDKADKKRKRKRKVVDEIDSIFG